MSRKVRQWILGFFAALALFIMIPGTGWMTAYAATARIAFSDPSVTVGQEFNVNVKITTQDGSLGASDVMLSYDPASIEFISGNNASGGAGAIRLIGTMDSNNTTQFSHTLKFKALQAGNSTISVGSYEIYDVNTQTVNVTKVGTSAVKINAPATYSSEARLSSLKVSPGQLTPAFSSDVTSYTVDVGGDVSKLAVSAGAKHSKAKVLVSGDSDLQVGSNKVVCKVTAEDGQTTKTYTITVNKSESAGTAAESEGAAETGAAVMGDQTAEVDGVTYSVASSFDAAALPEGFTSSSISYNGTDIMCGTGNDMTLIYLQSADGAGSFFIYVPETGALSPYVSIDVSAKSIVVLPPDASVALPDGFAETTIQLNGNYKVHGWVWQSDEEQQYCVVYGMNEQGEKNLYRYDIKERTFQRYFQDPALQSKYDDAKVDELIGQYNSLCEDYNFRFIIIVVLIVVCLILFFAVVNLLLRRKSASQERDMYRDEPRRDSSQAKNMKKAAPDRRSSAETSAARRYPSEMNTGSGRTAGDRSAAAERSRMPERGTAERSRMPERSAAAERSRMPERSGAEERKAAYERAVASERKASAAQTAAMGHSASYERRPSAQRTPAAEERAYGAQRPMNGRPVSGSAGRTAAAPARDRNHDPGMEEIIRRRELERAERARMEREQLEKNRRQEELRARAARESAATVTRPKDEDDFEFIEL